jgi:hypothetical protein
MSVPIRARVGAGVRPARRGEAPLRFFASEAENLQ